MGNTQYRQINISAPNLVAICVDEVEHGEISGRLYHCYQQEPVLFFNVIELLREMEELFDTIGFPQASTKTRSFLEKEQQRATQVTRPERVVVQTDIIQNTGGKGTFVTNVRYRQNSTWQGNFFWMEQEKQVEFSNTLEFIRQLDAALEKLEV